MNAQSTWAMKSNAPTAIPVRRQVYRSKWKKRAERMNALGLTTRGTARKYRLYPARPDGLSVSLWHYRVRAAENLAAGLTALGKTRAAWNARRTNSRRRAWQSFRDSLAIQRTVEVLTPLDRYEGIPGSGMKWASECRRRAATAGDFLEVS